MEHISNHEAQIKVQKGAAVIIDVRETGEFREQHISGAINIPSTAYKPEHYGAFSDLKICLICQSGQRSKKIHDLLKKTVLPILPFSKLKWKITMILIK